MEARVLIKSGKAVAVSYVEKGSLEACVISARDLPADARVDKFYDVDEEVLAGGTEYGVDWSVLLSSRYYELAPVLQQSLRRYGVWTLEDYQENPQDVRDALNAVVNLLHIDLQEAVMHQLN